jgi:transcriptional regulator with GAF, ATPase, and Fis domain
LLVQHFVDKYNARFNRSITSINKQSLKALQEYQWPGNIRELEHLVERAVLSAKSEILKVAPPTTRVEHPAAVHEERPETVSAVPNQEAIPLVTLAENERNHIRMVLSHTRGQISGPHGAAAILGLPPSTLRSRIKKLGLKIHLNDPH